MKMAHTCVRIRDLEVSLDFYQKVLNFEGGRRRDLPENKFTLVYLTSPGDDYEPELTYNYDHEVYDLGNGYGHIAISTDDLGGLCEKHQAAGFTAADLKGLPGTTPSYYFVADPDGYKTEVIRERQKV